ncbi:MAG: hypothetical protein KAG56_02785 [Sulfurovaceae bacterium]|nr:hypothetical protein [Sulfurovaceae bacterium]
MNVNTVLMLILIVILSIGGYFIWDENNVSNNRLKNIPKIENIQNIKVEKIVIPKKSIEFSILKKINNEYIFSGIFSKEDTPKILVENINMKKLKHNIHINNGLAYNKEVVILGKKLFKELIDNYAEGSIIFKKNKLLVTGTVRNEKHRERVETILGYSVINSFNSTKVNSDVLPTSNLEDETVDIISNLVRTVEKGEDTIAEISKPKVIIKEKIVIQYKEPKVIIKYKEAKVKIQEKIVIKYKEPIIKEKVIIKYINVPVESSSGDKVSKITKEEYVQQLHSKDPDKNIMALPLVDMVDIDIEDKIKKGVVKALKTNKPLVERETVYIPSTEKQIDKKIPWANLHEMDAELNGIVYDDVVAGPSN